MRKTLAGILCIVFIAGCSTHDHKYPDRRDIEDVDFDAMMGVSKQELSELTPRLGQNCPYPEYRNPVVMPLQIPGTVRDGYFVPAHYEYVVVNDGYWHIRDHTGSPVGITIPGNKHCRIPK